MAGGGRTLRAGAGRFLQLLVVEQRSPDGQGSRSRPPVVAGHDLPYVFVRASAKVRNTRARGRQVDDFGVVWRGTKVALLMLPAHLSVHTSKGVSGGKLLDPLPGLRPLVVSSRRQGSTFMMSGPFSH
jgi:hypothetical protein